MQVKKGFTLIEMMVVLAVIAILALVAIPSNTAQIQRAQINKALEMTEHYKANVTALYQASTLFPPDNATASMPAADKLISPYNTKLELENGVFHLTLGNDAANTLKGKIISVRPLIVNGSPQSPIHWACGFKAAPDGMIAVGNNKTNVEPINLPLKCR